MSSCRHRYNIVWMAWLILVFIAVAGRLARAQSSDSPSLYVDNAVISTQVRFRFDTAYGANVPDRAEFFYGKCGCFRSQSPGDPNAPGPASIFNPTAAETNVDFQDIRMDIEFALSKRLSLFTELPVRFLNPQVNQNTSGLADIRAGFKYGLLVSENAFLTLQLRTYWPTGNALAGLGTDHFSIEPSLIYYRRIFERLTIETEFRTWIPIGDSSAAGVNLATGSVDADDRFGGEVLRYGLGLGYDLVEFEHTGIRLTPVVELVGWEVLDGFETLALNGLLTGPNARSSKGITTINLKAGVRVSSDEGSSIAVGYGRALTDDVWYQDIVRVEYRRAF